jgi:hypothetical protein
MMYQRFLQAIGMGLTSAQNSVATPSGPQRAAPAAVLPHASVHRDHIAPYQNPDEDEDLQLELALVLSREESQPKRISYDEQMGNFISAVQHVVFDEEIQLFLENNKKDYIASCFEGTTKMGQLDLEGPVSYFYQLSETDQHKVILSLTTQVKGFYRQGLITHAFNTLIQFFESAPYFSTFIKHAEQLQEKQKEDLLPLQQNVSTAAAAAATSVVPAFTCAQQESLDAIKRRTEMFARNVLKLDVEAVNAVLEGRFKTASSSFEDTKAAYEARLNFIRRYGEEPAKAYSVDALEHYEQDRPASKRSRMSSGQ